MNDDVVYRYIAAMGIYQYMGLPDAPNTSAKDIESIIQRNDHYSLKKVIDFVINHYDYDCATWYPEDNEG